MRQVGNVIAILCLLLAFSRGGGEPGSSGLVADAFDRLEADYRELWGQSIGMGQAEQRSHFADGKERIWRENIAVPVGTVLDPLIQTDGKFDQVKFDAEARKIAEGRR